VFNYSSKTLTEDQKRVLSYGLTFVPSRKLNLTKLLTDLTEWERRMRLREFFHDNEKNCKAEENEKSSKTWTPSCGREPWLDLYIQTVKEDIVKNIKTRFKKNLSKREEVALKNLLLDDSIVIRPADKGSGVVVLDAEDYEESLKKELEDCSTYCRIDNDITQEVCKRVNKLLRNLRNDGVITKDLEKHMTIKTVSAGKLKGNPKIHKPSRPMRTIVSSRNHPTEGIAKLAEVELKKGVEKLPSFIRDTTHFLNRLRQVRQPLPSDVLLFTMDVKGLYPNVPRVEARLACKQILDKRLSPTVPTERVLEMIDVVLENNNFRFGSQNYTQTEGTAIGSKLGMHYASAYMGEWESELLKRVQKKPLQYYRFVDDIFGIWPHGEESLKNFCKEANKIHPRIQLTLEYSHDSITFLDTRVKVINGTIQTDLYTKPTDQHLYLHSKSDHPSSMKRAIPYGLGIRLRRICSEDVSYDRNRKALKEHLHRRGYKKSEVEKQLGRVDNLSRDDLLNQTCEREENQERVPLVLTYSGSLPNIHRILRARASLLQNSERLKDVFRQQPMVAYRRGENLMDMLVHKKTNKIFKEAGKRGMQKCGRKRCAICKFVRETETLRTPEGKLVEINQEITCLTKNVVYATSCKKCDRVIYIGETGTTLYQRTMNHLSSIRNNRYGAPLARHFNDNEHSIDDFMITGIEISKEDSIVYRRLREAHWVKRMRTVEEGENKKQ